MARLPATRARWRFVYLATAVLVSLVVYFQFFPGLEMSLVRLNQLSIEVERRIQWWDWKDRPEEVMCRARHDLAPSKVPIPNVAHFVLLAKEGEQAELSFSGFLAIKSALVRMNATEVKLHTYTLNTQNVWWKQLENHVTLVPHDRFALHGPKNINISSFLLPHQSDFLRLDILRLEGGVYLDMDMFPLKPFSDLLSNPRDAVLGHEGGNRYGLGNAVILTRPSSAFLLKWWATYASFNDRIWNDHSVLIPKRIAISHPDLVCTLSPTVFYWPTWAKTHTHYMHDPISANEAAELKGNMSRYGGAMYENQLGWHGSGGGLDYLAKLTPEALLTTDTRFNILVRGVYAAEL